MMYAGKDLSLLTDEELAQAASNIQGMLDNLNKKRQHPKFKKAFENQPPPTINPVFNELKESIDRELKKRELA